MGGGHYKQNGTGIRAGGHVCIGEACDTHIGT